jgi:flagellar assembly factor FliW
MSAAPAVAHEPRATRRVASDLLGPIDVEPERVLTFAAGLYGFPECTEFVLVPADLDALYWLQSANMSAVAFLTADPFHFFPSYAIDLSAADSADLGHPAAHEITLLAIVTLGTGTSLPTINLQAPLAIHTGAGCGKQLLIQGRAYGPREPLVLG